MGILDSIIGAERTMVPASLSLETLRQMGLIRRHGDRGYIIVVPPTQTAVIEGTERAEGLEEPAPEAPTETEAPRAAPAPSRADDRFESLEGAVGSLQADLAEHRGTFTDFRAEVRARFDQIEQLLR